MSKRLLIGIALVVMSVSVVGAASYTSATVDRQASIAVSPDSTAIIGLDDGPVSGVTETDGKLDINLGQAHGLNVDASFVFGASSFTSSSDPHAFTITNNDANDHEFTLSYTLDGSDPDSSSPNVLFEVYDSDGNSVLTASEGGSGTATLTADTTYYVVVTVDTTGLPTTSANGLSGTLTVSAN